MKKKHNHISVSNKFFCQKSPEKVTCFNLLHVFSGCFWSVSRIHYSGTLCNTSVESVFNKRPFAERLTVCDAGDCVNYAYCTVTRHPVTTLPNTSPYNTD